MDRHLGVDFEISSLWCSFWAVLVLVGMEHFACIALALCDAKWESSLEAGLMNCSQITCPTQRAFYAL
jgi:hypothetical protein